MFTTFFFSMSLAWQSSSALGQNPLDLVEMMYEAQAREESMDRAFQRQSDAARQHAFILRFNHVAKALAEFGETWNQSHKVDQHEAQRLRKAWRDLEKTDGWFDTSSDSN